MDNALNLVQSWINNSRLKVRVIPRSDLLDKCNDVLGISEQSVLGTLINHVGGISVANGVIRHFGGTNKYGLSIKTVNGIGEGNERRFKGVLIIGDDIYGGLFAINESLSIDKPGKILYLPPDSYVWESLGIGHSAFVNWSILGDVALFYKKYQFIPVEANIPFDFSLDYTPPLWSENVGTGNFKYIRVDSSKMHSIRSEMLGHLT